MTSLSIVRLFAGVSAIALPWVAVASAADQTRAVPATASAPAEIAERVRAAANEGKLSYRLTTLDESAGGLMLVGQGEQPRGRQMPGPCQRAVVVLG